MTSNCTTGIYSKKTKTLIHVPYLFSSIMYNTEDMGKNHTRKMLCVYTHTHKHKPTHPHTYNEILSQPYKTQKFCQLQQH